MTQLQREALQMCLEYIETDAHERRHVRWKINEALEEQPAPVQQEPVATLYGSLPVYDKPAQQEIPDLIAREFGVSRGTAYDMMREALAEQPAQQQEHVANGKLKVTLQDTPTEIELAQYKRMFSAACAALGEINEALGLDPDDGGAEPILSAIAELKSCATCEALARTVMLDQTSHDTSLQPAQRKPLTVHEIAEFVGTHEYGEEQLKWFRLGEAAHGIKENT